MRRVDPDRCRRYMERSAAFDESQHYARWLAAMTPEHRAVHRRGLPCGECLAAGMRAVDRRLAQLVASSAHPIPEKDQ